VTELLRPFADYQHLILAVALVFAWRWFKQFQTERSNELQAEVSNVMENKLKNGLRDMVREEIRMAIREHETVEAESLRRHLVEVRDELEKEAKHGCEQVQGLIRTHDGRLSDLEAMLRALTNSRRR
jgi:predicted negative regulator of RcsB-dependent stress response